MKNGFTQNMQHYRLRYLEGFEESQYLFLDDLYPTCHSLVKSTWHSHRVCADRYSCRILHEYGFEFTKRLGKAKDEHNLTLFESYLRAQNIPHKTIRPYTPRHNGKVERNHREDQKRLYDKARFFSFEDFKRRLRRHNQRTNHIPMRHLNFLSPMQFLNQTV